MKGIGNNKAMQCAAAAMLAGHLDRVLFFVGGSGSLVPQ